MRGVYEKKERKCSSTRKLVGWIGWRGDIALVIGPIKAKITGEPKPQDPDMPLGIERINARQRAPNDRIVFIKPLEGPDKALAQDFLERVAAVCSPIMRANHLAVMSLEEHEPNLEFVGRNFNAGEVIQLVLKAPYTGHWLPFRHVQMVMMHELAHCKQMNHSGAFWKVRNQYCNELRQLWRQNYTGDGFWSRGQTLLSGQYTTSSLPATEVLPDSLCGGTYRTSYGRKRKRGRESSGRSSLSYAERQQRRIARKFGVHGSVLGEDQNWRATLEQGKKTKGMPRVAGSVRGRELRAAAALQRFEDQRVDNELKSESGGLLSGSGSESDYDIPDIKEEATSGNGKRIVDSKGRGMIQVCKSEGDTVEIEEMKKEMKELQEVDRSRDGLVVDTGSGTDSRGQPVGQGTINVASDSKEDVLATRSSKPVITKVPPPGRGSYEPNRAVPPNPLANKPFRRETNEKGQSSGVISRTNTDCYPHTRICSPASYLLQLLQLLLNFTSSPQLPPSPGIRKQEPITATAIEDIVMAQAKYTLPPLPYGYDALQPYISAQIMTIHHTKHHQAYVNNLNAALVALSSLTGPTDIPAHIALQQAIKFNGGGHINHSLFWENLTPANLPAASTTAGPGVLAAIKGRWHSEKSFKDAFSNVLLGLQGSGWGWLVKDEESGALEIVTTKDQDPVPAGKVPIFGVDMWEHAYYLQASPAHQPRN
ncbi:MAG: hypothetical protein M1840_002648 [Geoglossum simile]|nr:MAG: hypothetical protein M1840_002648 [Geoglossum simile]